VITVINPKRVIVPIRLLLKGEMALQPRTVGNLRVILPENIKVVTPRYSIHFFIHAILKVLPAGPAPDNDGNSFPAFVQVLEVDGDLTGLLAGADARFISGASRIAEILQSYFFELNRGA